MPPLLKPPRVAPPAMVGVFAPASPVRADWVEAGVNELRRIGFRVRLGRSLSARTRYLAGGWQARMDDLLELWEDPEVSAVFCVRGGYGSMHLLEAWPARLHDVPPKVFVGSSDATALLLAFARRGRVAFHGPMVAQQIARGEAAYDRGSLLGAIGRPEPLGRMAGPELRVLHAGAAQGILLGGCLSLVASLVGTGHLPNLRGAILFLEDVAAKPYQIDRMFTQLRLAGCLEEVQGIVFGEMLDCEQHPEQGYRLDDVLADLTRDLGVPVLAGVPSGHTRSLAVTLPFGVAARVDGEGLEILEGAVS